MHSKTLLECSALIGRNELLTYISNYNDIFDNENNTRIHWMIYDGNPEKEEDY